MLNRATGSALLAVLLWSTLAAVSLRLESLSPFVLAACGFWIGGAFLAGVGAKHWRWSVSDVAIGVFGIAGYHIFYFFAFRHGPSLEVNLVNYLWPVLIVVLSPLFFWRGQPRVRQLLGAALGFVGAAVAIWPQDGFSQNLPLGYAFAFGAAATWACYSLLIARRQTSPWQTGLSVVASALVCTVVSFALGADWAPVTNHWFELLYTGAGPMGLGFWAWNYAMKNGDPVRLAPISFLTPLLSTLLLAFNSGTSPRPVFWVAFAIVLAGIALSSLGRSHKSLSS